MKLVVVLRPDIIQGWIQQSRKSFNTCIPMVAHYGGSISYLPHRNTYADDLSVLR